MTRSTPAPPTAFSSRLVVEALPRLDALAASDWSGLRAPAGLYQDPAWLAVAEDMALGPATYLRATTPEGDCAGVAPLYGFPEGGGGLYDPVSCLGTELAGRLGLDRGHAVLGGRAGYLSGWRIGDHADTIHALYQAAREQTWTWGLGGLSAPFLPAEEARRLSDTGLCAMEAFVPQALQAVLRLPGAGFDDYLAALPPSRVAIVRRDLRRFAASGLTLHHGRLSEAMAYAPALLAKVQGRHGAAADPVLMERMLEAQRRRLDPLSLVITALRPDGEPVAYALSYAVDPGLYVRLVGLDHDEAERSGAYFVTAYYEQIRHAYRRGLGFVHLGVGSLRPKALRGASLEPLYGMFEGRDGPLPASEARRLAVSYRDAQQAQLGPLAETIDWGP